MKAVLILEKNNEIFYPLIDKNESISFLPTTLESNVLSNCYSWINSYFSKDKIFVVCEQGEEKKVKEFCSGIDEENILIEPNRINYFISVFYAANIINKIYPDSIIFFIPVNFIFPYELKIKNWLLANNELAEKEKIIIPTYLLSKDEKETNIIDAGRIYTHISGIDFFKINSIYDNYETPRKRKIFGKQGIFLNIICGLSSVIQKIFLDTKDQFFLYLANCFSEDVLNWNDLVKEYNRNKIKNQTYNIFDNKDIFLTFFLESKPCLLNSLSNYFNKLKDKNNNYLQGNISSINCSNIICYNYDKELLSIEGINDIIINKKNGLVTIKKIMF